MMNNVVMGSHCCLWVGQCPSSTIRAWAIVRGHDDGNDFEASPPYFFLFLLRILMMMMTIIRFRLIVHGTDIIPTARFSRFTDRCPCTAYWEPPARTMGESRPLPSKSTLAASTDATFDFQTKSQRRTMPRARHQDCARVQRRRVSELLRQ